jgi:hypothetical protein
LSFLSQAKRLNISTHTPFRPAITKNKNYERSFVAQGFNPAGRISIIVMPVAKGVVE